VNFTLNVISGSDVRETDMIGGFGDSVGDLNERAHRDVNSPPNCADRQWQESASSSSVRLDRHESHSGPFHGLRDRFGILIVVLVGLTNGRTHCGVINRT